MPRWGSEREWTRADSAQLVGLMGFLAGRLEGAGTARTISFPTPAGTLTLTALSRDASGSVDSLQIDYGEGKRAILSFGRGDSGPRIATLEGGRLVSVAAIEASAIEVFPSAESDCITQFFAAAAAMGGGVAGLFAGATPVGYAGLMAVIYSVSEWNDWLNSDCPETFWGYIESAWDDFTDWWCGEIGLFC